MKKLFFLLLAIFCIINSFSQDLEIKEFYTDFIPPLEEIISKIDEAMYEEMDWTTIADRELFTIFVVRFKNSGEYPEPYVYEHTFTVTDGSDYLWLFYKYSGQYTVYYHPDLIDYLFIKNCVALQNLPDEHMLINLPLPTSGKATSYYGTYSKGDVVFYNDECERFNSIKEVIEYEFGSVEAYKRKLDRMILTY